MRLVVPSGSGHAQRANDTAARHDIACMMKKTFGHLLPPSEEETSAIWSAGILTLDANVLLDLYRFQPGTRDSLLAAIGSFNGRLWLSHQAASEFVRNRSGVKAGVSEEFKKAVKALEDFEKSMRQAVGILKGARPVPESISDEFVDVIAREIAATRAKIDTAHEKQKHYLKSDSILEHILGLFEAIGEAPSADIEEVMIKEGQRRIKDLIPPGYSDSEKEGKRACGDYFVWSQVLDYAKKLALPLILVTSDSKGDWWEKHHNQIVSLRQELLEEAYQKSGQRILVYRTEQFLKLHAERSGREPLSSALADIRAIQFSRVAQFSTQPNAERIVQETLEAWGKDLVDSDEAVCGRIAETNATDFDLEEVDVHSVGEFNFDEGKLPFSATLRFVGQQIDDEMYYGDTVVAKVSGEIAFDGSGWDVIRYTLETDVEFDWDYSDD